MKQLKLALGTATGKARAEMLYLLAVNDLHKANWEDCLMNVNLCIAIVPEHVKALSLKKYVASDRYKRQYGKFVVGAVVGACVTFAGVVAIWSYPSWAEHLLKNKEEIKKAIELCDLLEQSIKRDSATGALTSGVCIGITASSLRVVGQKEG